MLHTRSELIGWIKKNVQDRVLSNAIEQGNVEVLGGFEPLPTSTNPGWIVRVNSPFGATHLIAVAWDVARFRLYWFRAPRVRWSDWAGHKSDNPLFAGDNPQLYTEWKEHDSRFTRIARSANIRPKENGGFGESGASSVLADREVPSPPSGQQALHNQRDRR